MIKKNIRLLENARKCLKTARIICCLARKLLEIFIARLGLARIFLENELLENARLKFYIPCSKSPSVNSATALILLTIKTEEYEENFTRMQG